MTILPDFLTQLVQKYWVVLSQWFSEQLYERLLRSQSQHLLVQIQRRFDFQPLEAACSGYHHQTGPGAKPTHTTQRLIRALLLRYLYRLSYRQLEAELQCNLLMRWFVGYSLFDTVPDHTTLERFEVWLQQQLPRSLFDAVLQQIDQQFPEQQQAIQVGDTFAMRANAAEETLIERLRHSGVLLLRELQQESSEQFQQVVMGLDLGGLLGLPDEKGTYHLSSEQRQQRLHTTVAAVLDLQQRVRLSGDFEHLHRVSQRMDNLTKIIQDELDVQQDAGGQVLQVDHLPDNQQGSYKIGSATDPQATYRVHGGSRTFGYNVSLTATPQGVIREIQVATGAQPDQAGVASLIEVQIEHGYPAPPKLIYDQAAGAGKTRAEVARASQGQTQLVAKLHTTAKAGRLGPQDFQFSAAEQAVTCPNEITTTKHYRSGNREGELYYWTAKMCQGCPFWVPCRGEDGNTKGDRRTFVSDHYEQVEAARQYNQTPAFQADMKLRPLIERVIFMLTNYDGARRAQSQGLPKADFQAKCCASARNLRTLIQLWRKREQIEGTLPGKECVAMV